MFVVLAIVANISNMKIRLDWRLVIVTIGGIYTDLHTVVNHHKLLGRIYTVPMLSIETNAVSRLSSMSAMSI